MVAPFYSMYCSTLALFFGFISSVKCPKFFYCPSLYRPVTTSLLVEDQLVHVGYAEERDDLFVMALPAHKAGLEKTFFFKPSPVVFFQFQEYF